VFEVFYHEELESLVKHIPTLKMARMTFSENYITHLQVLQNIGISALSWYEGTKVVPKVLALLPDPSSLAEDYTGQTSIGCLHVSEGRKRAQVPRVQQP